MKKSITVLLCMVIVMGCGYTSDEEGTTSGNPDWIAGNRETGGSFSVPRLPFDPHHYVVYMAGESIDVDGSIDEESWSKAEWTEYFVDIEGELQPAPTYQTRVKMLWDEQYFYFAADLEEPDLWATLTERDAVIFRDNDFEIFIDPTGDTHNYFEFEINAFGTIWDLFLTRPYRDGGRAINSWNMLNYKAAVALDGTINDPDSRDNGWTIEVALPLEELKEIAPGRRLPEDGDQWRVNFSRVQWQLDVVDDTYQKRIDPATGKPFPEYNWVWSPQGLINMHYPEMWGLVQFSAMIVGEGEDEFTRQRDEPIKWALRQVYYRQREYYRNHGYFTEDHRVLNTAEITVEGMNFNPEIRITNTMFEASAKGHDRETTWYISHDGKIWKE